MEPLTPNHRSERVTAVVVTFNPHVGQLQRLMEAVFPQVVRIVVVDNSMDSTFWQAGGFDRWATLIALGHNHGIAAAQNRGAQAAIDAGTDFILWLDQDSVPAPSMVAELLAAWRSLGEGGARVAAVGPLTLGPSGPTGFIRFGLLGRQSIQSSARERTVPCDMLIASGSLSAVDEFLRVGWMNEALFIDKVDTEWCLRAASLGMRCFGVPSATMAHSLGQREGRAWIFGWRRFGVHPPFRYYYIFRNSVLVGRMPHANWRWRRVDASECIKALVYFAIFTPPRRAHLKMMLHGIADGLRSIGGPKPP